MPSRRKPIICSFSRRSASRLLKAAGQDADLVLRGHRHGARVRAVARALHEAHQRAHRARDAARPRSRRARGPAPSRPGRPGPGCCGTGGRRPSPRPGCAAPATEPTRLAGGRLQRHLRRRCSARPPGRARRARRRGCGELGPRRGPRGAPPPCGPSDETESCGGWPVRWVRNAISLWVSLWICAGQGLVDAVARDQHAHEVGAGLHGHGDRVVELVALAPDRGRLLALERLHDDRVLREVLALGRGPVAARDDACRPGRWR